jgi:hypothetical protein
MVPTTGVHLCSSGTREAITGELKNGAVTEVSSKFHTRVPQRTFTRWSFSDLTL